LLAQLRIGAGEELVGFVSMGSIREAPPAAKTPLSATAWTCWIPNAQPLAGTLRR